MTWVVVLVARVVPCTLCGQDIPVPTVLTRVDQVSEIVDTHLATHAAEVQTGLAEVLAPRCARCKRVPLAGPVPHRPCFLPDCCCPCSHPKEG